MTVAETVLGTQTPRICSLPPDVDYELAEEALKWLDEVVGFDLDEWQQLVLRESLGESRPGSWAAIEVGLVVSRQNGKGAILEARELVGLFLLQEPLLIHSAHQFKTAQEHFLRLSGRIEDVPELKRRVKAIRTGAGEQGIILKSGARLRILARKGGSGRGFSAPFVAFDEAMDLPESTVGDMIPTQSAMRRRQRWYTGSAVDQFEHPDGIVFARVRERGIRGGDKRLAFFEWSVDVDDPEKLTPGEMLDDHVIATANPGYNIRISREAVEEELASLAPRTAAVERFGAGDWPAVDGAAQHVISIDRWLELVDDASTITGKPVLCFDVSPTREFAAIAAAALRADGLIHVEVLDHGRGTGWIVDRLAELKHQLKPAAILCDGVGPASSLLPELQGRRITIESVTATEHGQACGLFFDAVEDRKVRHLGTQELLSALKGAAKRPLGEAWAWSRRNSTVDITPLVACTLAYSKAAAVRKSRPLVAFA